MSQTTIAATLRLPAPQPRGPVSTAVLDALAEQDLAERLAGVGA